MVVVVVVKSSQVQLASHISGVVVILEVDVGAVGVDVGAIGVVVLEVGVDVGVDAVGVVVLEVSNTSELLTICNIKSRTVNLYHVAILCPLT